MKYVWLTTLLLYGKFGYKSGKKVDHDFDLRGPYKLKKSSLPTNMAMTPTSLVVAVALASQWNGAQGWQQDRFVISMCNDPIVTPDQFAYRWQEIAEANFTVVISGAWLTLPTGEPHASCIRMQHTAPERAVVLSCCHVLSCCLALLR